MYNITRFAFGRDNNGGFTDRALGTYTIEFTDDGGDTWFEVCSIGYESDTGFTPSLRHEYNVEVDGGGPVVANGIRIHVPQGGVFADGTAIDEIELYGLLIPPGPPAGVPGAALWLKADSLSLTNGAAVTAWLDQSGNGHVVDRTGLTYLTAPTFQTNDVSVFNGQPTVFFNGSTMWTEGTDPVFDAREIFAVVTMDSDSENIATLLSIGAEGTPPFQQVRRNGLNEEYGDDAGFDFGGGADGIVRVNGNIGNAVTFDEPNIFNATENTTVTYTNLFLGFNVVWGRPWKGHVAELIIYSNALSTSERIAVGIYLSDKYNITESTYKELDPVPPSDGNVSAWYNANDLRDLVDGDSVEMWEDRSGNGNNLVRTGLGGSSPTLQTNAPSFLNGRTTVSFNGSPIWTIKTNAIPAQEVFAVLTLDSDSDTIATLLSLGAEGFPPFQQIRRAGTDEAYADDAAFDFGGGSDGVIRIDGVEGTAITFGAPHTYNSTENTYNTFTNLYLGWNVIHGRYWKGQVAEIIIYDKALSEIEREEVNNYLAAKYGTAGVIEPEADIILVNATGASINWTGMQTGWTYNLEVTEDLMNPSGWSILTNFLATNGVMVITDTNTAPASRVYRLTP
jgi:hypothetical protein